MQEAKMEAVRLVKGGQEAAVTARVLGIPKATLGNGIRASENGELHGAGDRPVSAELKAVWPVTLMYLVLGVSAGGAHPRDPRRVQGRVRLAPDRRLHSTLGYISPMKFEANWHAGQVKKAA